MNLRFDIFMHRVKKKYWQMLLFLWEGHLIFVFYNYMNLRFNLFLYTVERKKKCQKLASFRFYEKGIKSYSFKVVQIFCHLWFYESWLLPRFIYNYGEKKQEKKKKPYLFLFLCEGNFQDRERMQIEKTIRLQYGRFFYRFPNGESAADVYDRITGIVRVVMLFQMRGVADCGRGLLFVVVGFRETLRSDIDIGRFQPPGEHNENMNLVIVSHGLTLRVFLMRWYKWTVEQFEGLQNLGNGGMMVMQTGSGGRYCPLLWSYSKTICFIIGESNNVMLVRR